VPIENVTSAQLEDIYSGRMTSWPGGETIRVILRPRQETNTRILLSLSPGMAAADAAARQQSWALVAVTDPESDEMVSALPGAIGAACLASVLAHRLPLRIVALDGVRGTTEDLARGRYPLAKPIILVTTARSPRAAQAIVDFVLSAEGRALAAKLGVVAERGGLAP
jgi:phosphate transport system substrate-binding protein